MRKLFLILFITFIFSSMFAETIGKKPLFVFSPTTGIFSGFRAGIGFANMSKEIVWEHTLNYQNELISHVAGPEITFESIQSHHFDSIYYQANRFWNSNRTNSYLIVKVGVFNFPPLEGLMSGFYCPMLTIGYGYSINIARKFFLRLSIDVGLQSNFINAGLAITF